ncbi:hypothetical protein [Brevundimonas sp.]|uniref:hypothetical protein n=1 Tax=Brevundimonas sp. TaxID=1871086 RepID=UPI003F6E9BF1
MKHSTEWLLWSGGENPAPLKGVDVRYRDGSEDYEQLSDEFDWLHSPRRSNAADIIAYRISPVRGC